MAIDNINQNKQNVNNLSSNRLQTAYQQEINNTQQALKAQQNGTVDKKAPTGGAEQVVLTDTAKKLNAAQDKAKNSSGVNSEKINAIKKALANGDYQINYERVADKMISQDNILSNILR
jgi:negative regulator of flagellin synthesis FlgM